MTKTPPQFDFTVTEYRGTLCILYPWSPAADAWIAEAHEMCGFELFGDGLCIDVKLLEATLDHIKEQGLKIEGEV